MVDQFLMEPVGGVGKNSMCDMYWTNIEKKAMLQELSRNNELYKFIGKSYAIEYVTWS